ncbi:FAD-dependent oxidoreductase [Nocardioides sp. zg-579]|uniref:FAD-dependent oxidoreductase n=1 Tax=Nocardioides marmotae TaxID=2663857 RepID=A0A6I3IT83_9ACTN|nr:FAD-dependent oxidoreductase [Nocardioides marmotae]MCR6030102.1 FAD-dependent oxidoreductase [Gordonia jinghuaiqii]MTB93733.1 FAD-dependent oxidoreductase [Nocardioides marmotae]QKE00076.1 FAD-dependent oxidoreductase [Nocardioides marmotae]
MSEIDFDVIVVGSGAAGLIAALTAQERGADVLVVEASATVGGASRLSHGHILASETHVQKALGLEDDKDQLYLEYMLANQWQIKPTIARSIADESGPVIDWLATLGLDFVPALHRDGGERVPRTHMVDGKGNVGGARLIDVLQRSCRQRGIDIVTGNRVDRLIHRDGAVVGVSAGGEDLTAHAVVLATGGFGANKELVVEHLPSVGQHQEWLYYIGPDTSQGDHIALADDVGAHLVGHDVCKPSLAPRMKVVDFDPFIPAWSLLLGSDGHRIIDETAPYGQIYGVTRQSGGVVHAVFDAATLAINDTPELPTFAHGGRPAYWSTDGIKDILGSGGGVEAATLEELAEKLSLSPTAVVGAVARYNSFSETGVDSDFGKEARFLRPVAAGPFYGIPLVTSVIGITAYGVEIDGGAQVLADDSRAIPGLYAAGECTGGVIGTRYLGGGNGLASATTMGRVAGASAGTYAVAARA